MEPLLKIVNVLCMRLGFGVAHSDQPAQHGYSGVCSVSAFYRIWRSQQKGFVCLRFCLQVVSKLGSGSARSIALARDHVFYF